MEGKRPAKPFDLKGLETLPPELLQNILIELDANSIKSALLSGAAFYRAFKSEESHVVRQFVRHNVSVNLFHDAVVAFRAIGAQSWPDEDIETLLAKYFSRDEEEFVELHKIAEFFCDKLASEALALICLCSPCHQPRNIGFVAPCIDWRFGAISAPNKSSGNQAKPSSLISHPGSVEQLACVYQGMQKVAQPVVNKLVGGNPETWNRNARRLALDNSAYQVCLGLAHVKKVIEAPLPTVRQLLVMKIEEARGWFFNKFMRRHIQSWDVKKASHRIDGEQGDLEFLPSYPDPDAGREDVWSWAHTGEKLIDAVNNPDRQLLRNWGHVMWDRRRLTTKKLMDQPWAG